LFDGGFDLDQDFITGIQRVIGFAPTTTKFCPPCPLWVKSGHCNQPARENCNQPALMSALPPKADIGTQSSDIRFVPKADIDQLIRPGRRQWKVCLAES
jgi:hypothetical protein